MAIKKVTKKEKEAEKKEAKIERYFYAVGKRKTSISEVRIFPNGGDQEGILINGKQLSDYFVISRHKDVVEAPLAGAGLEKKYGITVKVRGGGINSQAEAIRLGISKALVKMNAELKKSLRDRGFLTRDARKVERKKPGLRKARRSPQWAKR